MKLPVFIIVSVLSLMGVQSHAETDFDFRPHAIKCVYGARGGTEQVATFVASESLDLLDPRLQTVEFSVNHSKELTKFAVARVFTKIGPITKFSFRHPSFVSDIVLTHYNYFDGVIFAGTWTTDYPPAHNLSCQFLE